MKRVFIVHRWNANPKDDWYPWLKKELEKQGYKVAVPKMPTTNHPKIKTWVAELKKQVGTLDNDTYFVGHSIGCQTIIRYLATQKQQCGGAIFVAGWFALTPEAFETKQDEKIAKPWLYNPIKFEIAKKNITQSTVILSDNDPYVEMKLNAMTFKGTLGSKIIMQKKKGHFTKDEKITNIPIILKELKIIAKQNC